MIIDRKIFFDAYRNEIDADKHLTQENVNNLNKFLAFVEAFLSWFTLEQWAYIFATVFWETDATFAPIIEAPKMTDEWRKRNFRYYPFYGRGYVQITWLKNYKLFSKLLNIDLVKNMELACKPDIAFLILINGFKFGMFTGRSLQMYVNEKKKDYLGARKVINGTDKDYHISKLAETFEEIIKKSFK